MPLIPGKPVFVFGGLYAKRRDENGVPVYELDLVRPYGPGPQLPFVTQEQRRFDLCCHHSHLYVVVGDAESLKLEQKGKSIDVLSPDAVGLPPLLRDEIQRAIAEDRLLK